MQWEAVLHYCGIKPERYSKSQDFWFAKSAFSYSYIGFAVAFSYSIFYYGIGAFSASLALGVLSLVLIGTTPLHVSGHSLLLAYINLSATSIALAVVVLHTGGTNSSGACWLLGVTPGITALLFRRYQEIIWLTALTLVLYVGIFMFELNGYNVNQLGYPPEGLFARVYSFIHFFAFCLFIATALSIFSITQNTLYERLQGSKQRLEQANAKLKAIFSSLHQAVFMIDNSLRMVGDRSLHTQKILGGTVDSFVQVIEQSDLTSDQRQMVFGALSAIIGEDIINLSANQHLLPTILRYKEVGSQHTKILSLQWTPILEHDFVQNMLLALRDITDLEESRKKEEESTHKNKLIMQLLNIPRKHLQQKIKELEYLASHLQHQFEQKSLNIDEIKILVHSLKGAVRSLKLNEIADACHNLESSIKQSNGDGDAVQAGLQGILHEVQIIVWLYHETMGTESTDKGQLQEEFFDEFRQELVNLPGGQSLMHAYPRLFNPLLSILQSNLAIEAGQLAEQLGKPKPLIIMEGSFHHLDDAMLSRLSMMGGHLIRNSLDHGLETTSERLEKGKPSTPALYFLGEMTTVNQIIWYSDDGRGINLHKIRAKAKDPYCSDEDLVELIFEADFSTRDRADMISGRGVGMTAIRNELRKLGGDIRVKFTSPDQGGFRAFKFQLIWPLPECTSLAKPIRQVD